MAVQKGPKAGRDVAREAAAAQATLNESLDELARVSDDLVDALEESPSPPAILQTAVVGGESMLPETPSPAVVTMDVEAAGDVIEAPAPPPEDRRAAISDTLNQLEKLIEKTAPSTAAAGLPAIEDASPVIENTIAESPVGESGSGAAEIDARLEELLGAGSGDAPEVFFGTPPSPPSTEQPARVEVRAAVVAPVEEPIVDAVEPPPAVPAETPPTEAPEIAAVETEVTPVIETAATPSEEAVIPEWLASRSGSKPAFPGKKIILGIAAGLALVALVGGVWMSRSTGPVQEPGASSVTPAGGQPPVVFKKRVTAESNVPSPFAELTLTPDSPASEIASPPSSAESTPIVTGETAPLPEPVATTPIPAAETTAKAEPVAAERTPVAKPVAKPVVKAEPVVAERAPVAKPVAEPVVKAEPVVAERAPVAKPVAKPVVKAEPVVAERTPATRPTAVPEPAVRQPISAVKPTATPEASPPAGPASVVGTVPSKPATTGSAGSNPENVAGVVATPVFFQPPTPLKRVAPVLPEGRLSPGERHTVVLRALVDDAGRVMRVEVEQGIDAADLQAAAVNALLHWTYRPALQQGRPIRGWITENVVIED